MISRIYQNKLFTLISLSSCIFFLAIAFDITPYLRGPNVYPPDWRWSYLYINTIHKIWAPIIVILLTISLVFFTEKNSQTWIRQHSKNLLITACFLFFFFQISTLYFSRAGVSVLFQRIAHPEHNGYFTASLHIQSLTDFLKNYNASVLHLPMHAQGHPPGAILFFWSINKFLQLFPISYTLFSFYKPSHADVLQLWSSLTRSQQETALVSGLLIPLLASCSLVPLYYLGVILYDARVAMRSVFLYMLLPSTTLFVPINDTFLPLFPLVSFLFLALGLSKQQKRFLFLSGFVFSLGLFFSISLLPILLIVGVYITLKCHFKKDYKNILFFVSSFLTGFVVLPLFLQFVFQLNSLSLIHTLISGLPSGRKYSVWVFYNLYDFFIFQSIPLFIYCIVMTIYYGKQIKNRQYKKIDILFLGFFSMLILLNFSGSVRGEVSRIWIPFVAFLILPISYFLTKKIEMHTQQFVILILIIALQTLLMQEFWVMLW